MMTVNSEMKGISIDNWIVFFVNKGTISQNIKYAVKNKENTANLLLGMMPGSPYMVNMIKGVSESHKEKVVASKEGTLFFTVRGSCHIEIAPF
jgi:hypothetical protein